MPRVKKLRNSLSPLQIMSNSLAELYQYYPNVIDDSQTPDLYAWLHACSNIFNQIKNYVVLSIPTLDDHSKVAQYTEFVETIPFSCAASFVEFYEDCLRIQILRADNVLHNPNAKGLYEKDGTLSTVYTSVVEHYNSYFPELLIILLKMVVGIRNNEPDWMDRPLTDLQKNLVNKE